MARQSLLVTLVLLFCLAHRADAQTTSVKIIPPDGGAAPAPAKPLDILDTEYPLLSLLADEQGTTILDLSLDSSGKPNAVQISMSSGYPALDQQSVQIARTRWAFQPGTTSIKIAVNWALPLIAVNEYNLDIPAAPEGASPPAAITGHGVVADDYPALAVRTRQQGIVVVRYLITEDGTVGDIQVASSSGVPRLDDAAVQMVKKRWKFRPFTLNGKPIAVWQGATVSFFVFPDAFDRAKLLRCYRRPASAQEQVVITAQMFSPKEGARDFGFGRVVERWTFVTRSGEQTDMLLSIKGGLKRPTKALRDMMKSSYPTPADANGCWYYDPIFLQRNP